MENLAGIQTELDALFGWVMDLTFPDILIAAIIPLVVWLFRSGIARLFVGGLAWILDKFGVSVDDTFRDGMHAAMGGLFVAVAVFLGVASLNLPPDVKAALLLILRSVIAVFVFWLINQGVQLLLEHREIFPGSEDYKHGTWLNQLVQLVVIILMFVVILKIWGIDLGPALTGLGIAGAAVAFGAQDLIRNLIAGFNNAGEKRFRIGDWVRVSDDVQGTVEKMNLRTTVLRRFDLGCTHVPNEELANAALVNFSQRGARRILWKVSLTYDTDAQTLETICESIRTYLHDSGQFVVDPQVNLHVRVYEFETSSIIILVDCFVAANDWASELAVRHDLLLAIKRCVENAGAHFAFPTRTVHNQHITPAGD